MRRLLLAAGVPFWSLFVEEAGERAPMRAAQMRQESGFRLDARSPVGALGPAQFMPKTWEWAIKLGWIPAGSDPRDPRMAIRAQDRYMVQLEGALGTWPKALAGYNCGEGGVRRAMRRVRERGLVDTPDRGLWRDFLPAETRHYIAVIPGKHLPWVLRKVGA